MEGQVGNVQQCKRGCGFYDSPGIRNLCSNCYRDYLKKQVNNNYLSLNSLLRFNKNSVVAIAAVLDTQSNEKKKNRCLCCKKKVGFIGFRCRCEGTFCGVHRFPETHECKINYKSAGRAVIVKENPLVRTDKLIDRI